MENINKGTLIVLAGFVLILAAGCSKPIQQAQEQALLSSAQNEKSCGVCNMYIERFKKTAVYIDYKNGTSEIYCGVECAIKRINQRGGYKVVRLAQVTEWGTRKLIDMKEATYVMDSKIAADMTTKILAFESKEAAEKFIVKKGGRVVHFYALLKGTSYP